MSEGTVSVRAGASARAQRRTAGPGARSRPRAGGAELGWAGTGLPAGVGTGVVGAPGSPVPAREALAARVGFRKSSRRDGAGPARRSWRPGPRAGLAAAEDAGEGRGEPPEAPAGSTGAH